MIIELVTAGDDGDDNDNWSDDHDKMRTDNTQDNTEELDDDDCTNSISDINSDQHMHNRDITETKMLTHHLINDCK